LAEDKSLPRGSLILRANTIEPVIGRAEVPAGIPDDRDVEVFQGLEDIFTEAIVIGEGVPRIIDSSVYTSAHMPERESATCSEQMISKPKRSMVSSHSLSKPGIDIRIDLRDAPIRVNRDNRGLLFLQLGKGSHLEK
jgi:hypothetical protein